MDLCSGVIVSIQTIPQLQGCYAKAGLPDLSQEVPE